MQQQQQYQRRRQWWQWQRPAVLLLPLLLRLLLQLQAANAAAAVGSVAEGEWQQRALLDEAVPGQAFHNWRDALIKANFTTRSSSSSIATGSNSAAKQQQQQTWINIVGLRDRITKLDGPPSVNTTHPAAAERLAAVLAAGHYAAAVGPSQQADHAAVVSDYLKAVAPIEGNAIGAVDAATSSSSSSDATAAATAEGPAAPSGLTQLPVPEGLELTLMSFVRRDPEKRHMLTVNNKPHILLGFDIPNALQMAVQSSQRHQLLYLLDRACQLGYNTIRVWAFSDGSPEVDSAVPEVAWQVDWAAHDRLQYDEQLDEAVLQPAPGVLNATLMSDGVDWLVHEAGSRGLRLIMVLTNGASTAGGGMQQYTHWVDPALTVVDFYGNDTVKSVFLDYIAGLLSHESTISGVPLREDPVIAGWQLAHHPTQPGQPASDYMLAWIHQMGIFMKEHAPHQLFLTGLEGHFGPHSRHHLQYNPQAQVFESASITPHSYNAVCSGADFWYHHQLAEVDVATAAVYPDAWVACDRSCKLSWTREWIRAHLRDAVRLQKPLLLAGAGVLRPHSWRREFLQLLHSELHRALEAGHPIGGIILSPLLHPGQPDITGYGIHDNAEAVLRQRPPLADYTQRAAADLTWLRFMRHSEYLSCLLNEARVQWTPTVS